MIGIKRIAVYVLTVLCGFWFFTSSIVSLKPHKPKTSIKTQRVTTTPLPHTNPTQKSDSPSTSVQQSTSTTAEKFSTAEKTSTPKIEQFDNLSSLIDIVSARVKLIKLVPIQSNMNAGSFSILESETPVILTGELNAKLIKSQCQIDAVESIDPRLLHRLKWKSVKQNLTSHIIINCNGIVVILTVLVPRNYYYWTAEFNSSDFEFQRPSRAFDKVLIDNLKPLKKDKRLWTPTNSSLWSWHFQYSKFIECDYENLVWPFRYLFKGFIESYNETIVQMLLTSIRKLSLTHRTPMQIFGGTLLGWYRQCDFIPYSRDVDIVMNETYFTYELFKDIWNGGEFNLVMRYGFPNESFEVVTWYNGGYQTDLFTWHYEPNVDNETYMNYYYRQSMMANRYTYPIVRELCSAELLGALVYVPCEPLISIEYEYKEGWFQPQRSHVSQSMVFYKQYTNETWKGMYHHYINHSCTEPSIMDGCD